MKFVIKLIFFFTLILQANAQTVLRFQKHILPNPRYLGDLVLTNNEKLINIPLDSHLITEDRLTKKQIIQWVTHKTGSLDYKWKGKSNAKIPKAIRTTGKELINKAQTDLMNQLKKKYVSVTLNVKGTIKNSEYPLTDFKVEIPNFDPPAKQICVRLKRGKRSIPIWFKVSAYQAVLVTTKLIKNRTELHQTDFNLQYRNVAGLKGLPLTQMPQSSWVTKSINADHILMQNEVVNIPSILRGQLVQVTVLNHGISVISKAIAQNDGYIGQMVRMKNPASNKFFTARITSPNQAEISS